jgi:hypothetical protein
MASEGGGWTGMFGAMYAAVNRMTRPLVNGMGWLYDQFRQPVAHGASELANGLFTGQSFVLYGHGPAGGQQPQQPQPQQQPEPSLTDAMGVKEDAVQPVQQEQKRMGMRM